MYAVGMIQFHHRSNDITSGILHAIGLGLAIAALVLMVIFSASEGSGREVVTVTIFGTGLVLLYSASTVYHLLPPHWQRSKMLFRKLDYSMIFVLIAATYTPICIAGIRGGWGWALFGINWGLAVIGIILKISPLRVPVWVYSVMYLVMGWSVIVALKPLLQVFSKEALIWLLIGGVLYTAGVAFYALDKALPPLRVFGLHELFHLFVMGGSFSHFWLMLHYL